MTMHRRLKQLCDVEMEFIRISDAIEVGQREIDKTFSMGNCFLKEFCVKGISNISDKVFQYF